MAIDFPNSPTLGQSYSYGERSWVWNGSRWEGVSQPGPSGPAGPPGKFTVSLTAPTTPDSGDAWFDSSRGLTFLYYDDGSSSQWIQIGSANAGPAGTPGPAGVAGEANFSSFMMIGS